MDSREQKRISKKMAYVLRHKAHAFGLYPDKEGFVEINQLVKVLKKWFANISESTIHHIVGSDPKGRYEIKGNLIRARYGHSYEVSLNYDEDTESELFYHATVRRNLEHIFRKGLLPMKRKYVHLSLSPEDAIEVGRRHGKDVVLLIIDSSCLREHGIKVLKASKKIRIASYIPSKCIRAKYT